MSNLVGQRIKSLMETFSMTQTELANKLNIAQNTVSRYISGSRKIDIDTLTTLSVIFNVTTDYLIGKSDTSSMVRESNLPYDTEGLTEDDIQVVNDLIESLKKRKLKKNI